MSSPPPSMMKKRSPWSDLHPDLLAEILKRLDDIADFIRSRAVCVSWRSIPAAKTMRKDIWLLSSAPSRNPDSRCFYSLASLLTNHQQHNKSSATKYVINLPHISGHECVGSSQGFLIMFHRSSHTLSALNPLTGVYYHFPSTAQCYPPIQYLSPDHSVTIKPVLSFCQAIISPSMDTAALVTYGPVYQMIAGQHTMTTVRMFSKVSFMRATDISWTPLIPPPIEELSEDESVFVDDIIFHKGCLYVFYSSDGIVVVFDLKNLIGLPYFVSPKLGGMGNHQSTYFAETPNGEDLLLLQKTERFKNKLEAIVFKLDKNTLEWNEVQDIGSIALFFGRGNVISVSTSEYPFLRSNCVYFTDYDSQIRVFNLKDRSTQPLTFSDDVQRSLPPVWFSPTPLFLN